MARALWFVFSLALGVSILSTVMAGPGDPGTKDSPAADASSKAAKAEADLMLGDFEAAEAGAAAVLKGTPDHGHALFVRGAVKLRRDMAHAEALKDLQAAIKAGHDNVTVRWHCFECRVALKDFESALVDAEKAAEFAPKSALAKRRVGDAQRLLGRHQDAIKTYGQALALDPGEYMARDGRARSYAGLANIRSALSDAQALAVQAPSHVGTWELLGEFQMFYRRYPEAAEAYRRATRLDPTMLTAWDNLAICLLRQDKDTEALPACITAAELAPSDARILTNLAVCLQRLGKHEDAIRRVSVALLHDKPTAYRWQLRGECHAELKHFELAAADFAASLSLDDEDVGVWDAYGEVLSKLNRYDRVLEVYEYLLLKLPENSTVVSERIEALCDLGRLEDAQRAVDAIPAKVANHPRVLMARCDLLRHQRKYQELLALCEVLVKTAPNIPLGGVGRAVCLLEMGKPDEALKALPESDDKYVTGYRKVIQAAIHASQGRWKEAEEVILSGLTANMDDEFMLRMLCSLYVETDQLRDADRASARLVREWPWQEENWILQARVCHARGSIEEARSCFDRAIEANPWSAGARNGRGYFLMMQGDHVAALPDIQKALELEPHNMPALMNLALIRAADPLGKTAGLEALKKVENEIEHRRKNGGDPLGLRLFSARVCAVRSLMMDPETAAKDRRSALEHLKAYRQAGRVLERDMRTELDLVALHGDPDFQALFETAEKK